MNIGGYLLRGLLALFLFVPLSARAEIMSTPDTEVSRVLLVSLWPTPTKANPHPHARRVWLPYPTLYTCEEAQDRLDMHVITEAAGKKLHAPIARSSAKCVAAGSII